MKVKDAHMQAYPFIEPNEDENIKAYHPGMTLRDHFAVNATEEDIKAHREGPMEEHIISDVNGRKQITHRSTRYTREQAKYLYADSMMKARKA